MRVIALLLAVGLIVVGGFWLARDRSGAAGQATSTATEAAADAAAGSDDPSAADGENQESTANENSEEASDPVQTDESAAQSGSDAAAAGDDQGDDVNQDAGDGDDPATPTATPPADGAADGAADAKAGDEAAAAEEPELGSSLPEGYEPVPYVTEEPRRVFDEAGEVLEEGLDYVAVLRTNRGDIVVDLYEDRTPETVNNLVFLALNRYYQGVPFHRVLEDFMAQTGDPTGTGSGGPGYTFEDEIVEGLVFDRAGLLAMANAGPGTNGSQFFITFGPTPWLDGGHTIFGHVLAGEELFDQIARVDPASPSAVVMPDETLAELAAQGIELPGDPEQTVESAIDELVGTTPVAGQSFTVAGYRGVLGQIGENPAYGFFNQPDTLLNVVIGQRPAS